MTTTDKDRPRHQRAEMGQAQGGERPGEAMNEQPLLDFEGATYEPAQDRVRLTGLLRDTFNIMRDGRWRTLDEIRVLLAAECDRATSDASISARLRDFRKAEKGGHTVHRRRRGNAAKGIHEYKLEVNRDTPVLDLPSALRV